MSEKEFKKYLKEKRKRHEKTMRNNQAPIKNQNDRLATYIEQCRCSYKQTQQNMQFSYSEAHSVTCENVPSLAWVADSSLKIIEQYPTHPKLEQAFAAGAKQLKWKTHTIPFSSIDSIEIEGDIYTDTKISGGGSVGPHLGDVIIGAAIAGVPGALIAGQSKTTPIQTITSRRDDRKTVVRYGNRKLEFAHRDYYTIRKIILDRKSK